jgi:hypothetical protein
MSISPFSSAVDVTRVERVVIPTLAEASLDFYQRTIQQSGTVSIMGPVRFAQGQLASTDEFHSNFSTLKREEFSVVSEAVRIEEACGRYREAQEDGPANAYRLTMFKYAADGLSFVEKSSWFVAGQTGRVPRSEIEKIHVAAAAYLLGGGQISGAEEVLRSATSRVGLSLVPDAGHP